MAELPHAQTRVLMKFADGKEVTIYNSGLWAALQPDHEIRKIIDKDDHVVVETCCSSVKIYDGDAIILRSMISNSYAIKATAL